MDAMSPATSRPRKTVEDYLALPDDVRAELMDGELYVTPSPELDHQRVVLGLSRRLAEFVENRELGEVFVAPLDVHLPSGDVVQPDVFFVAAARLGICRPWVHGVPDVVIEVVSPDRPERDRSLKRRLYAQNRVPEYWIVDPQERSVEKLHHEADVFRPAGYLLGDAVLESRALPGLALRLSDVWV